MHVLLQLIVSILFIILSQNDSLTTRETSIQKEQRGFGCNCRCLIAPDDDAIVVIVDAIAFHCIALLTFTVHSFVAPLPP